MSRKIEVSLLRALGSSKSQAELFAPLLEAGRVVKGNAFETITSRAGIAMLVSQLTHESGHFMRLTENMNYDAKVLRTGNRAKYFTDEEALRYGYIRDSRGMIVQRANERMVANLFYGSRLGNLGSHTDDGWNFRGAGLIQLTGRYNFTEFGKSESMTAEEAAAFCRTPEGAVKSAYWYWRTCDLLIPASRGDVVTCTKLIQGGDGALATRTQLYRIAFSHLA